MTFRTFDFRFARCWTARQSGSDFTSNDFENPTATTAVGFLFQPEMDTDETQI